jgi:hypothetical protein
VTSLKRFNSYEIFYDGKGKGDILGQVTSLKRFNSYEIFYYEEQKVDLLKKEVQFI